MISAAKIRTPANFRLRCRHESVAPCPRARQSRLTPFLFFSQLPAMKPLSLHLRHSLLMILLGVVLTGLTACASLNPSPEDAVRARAQERWQYMIKSDFVKAYDYTTPAYKAIHPAQSYYSARGTAAQWKEATVLEVQCPEADKCTARVRLDAIVSGVPKALRNVSTVLDETWLREDGQWWYYEKL